MKCISKIGMVAAILILTTSCGNYKKLLNGTDYEAKFTKAMQYYENKDYSKAIQLFENLTMHYHGKEHAEDITWYYSMSLMAEKDFFSAGYSFKNFFKRFPYSPRAEEALYNAAECKYHESPEYFLDQKQTREAIQEYESYLDRYPGSLHVPEINAHLDELRNKLMHKDYDIAYGYYLTENYHAAYVSLQLFLNNYPDSPYQEQALFYMLASSYQYGINSTPEKMRERLMQVSNDFDRFSSTCRDSKFMPQAQEYYTKARAALARIDEEEKNAQY